MSKQKLVPIGKAEYLESHQETKKRIKREYKNIWLPNLLTKGKPDMRKIRNEILDLTFVLDQVSRVYCEITGNKLSYPTYFADTIIGEYEDRLQDAYAEGYSQRKADEIASQGKKIAV